MSFLNLKKVVEEKMSEMLDHFVEDIQSEDSDNNPVWREEDWLENYYQENFDDWFNSDEEWWDFIPEEDLTIRHINELLATYKEMVEEFGPSDGSTVDKLLRLYGFWTAKQEEDKYIHFLRVRLENPNP
jgi:hypothetical protein